MLLADGQTNYKTIENDMNLRNCCIKAKNSSINSTTSISSNESSDSYNSSNSNNRTRKKREELSSNASRSIKKEFVITTVEFH